MNETWENGKKKTYFGPHFGPNFISWILTFTLLQAIIVCNYKEKTNLGPFWPQIFFVNFTL